VRNPEEGLLDTLEKEGIGCIAFSPLAQGILTSRYMEGIPAGSRAERDHFLKKRSITPELLEIVKELGGIAAGRGQTLPQLALAWLLKDHRVTSVLIGASSVKQLKENLAATKNLEFSESELVKIEKTLSKYNYPLR
jgi:L-glyceraldehyde 3-phosphate reductase